MSSPDLPQPIYPNAPSPQPQPTRPAYGPGAPGGHAQQGPGPSGWNQPPQQGPGPGGWNQPPQQHYPAPAGGQPGGDGRRTQILLAAGAAVVVAAVVLVIVLVTRSGDNTAGTDGTGTTPVVNGGNQQTVDNGGGNQTPDNGGGNAGGGADAAQVKAELSALLGNFYSDGSLTCMTDRFLADEALFNDLNSGNITESTMYGVYDVIVGCSSTDERISTVTTNLTALGATSVTCPTQVMFEWDDSTWVDFFVSSALDQSQNMINTLSAYFPNC